MQTLLLVSMYEFKLFLQIVLWISIPATVLAIVITTILHYRRKKKLRDGGGLVAEPFHAMISSGSEPLPDWLASSNPDNASLLKKYEREVRRYREDYANLEQDFRQLEEKYTDLLNKAYHNDGADDNGLAHLHQEIKEYKLKITQLQQALEQSEHDQLVAAEGADPSLQEALTRLREENALLKEKLADYEMTQDLLQAQKQQTEFLQQQLELRIKGYHQLEKQAGESTAQLHQLRLAAESFQKQEEAWMQEREEYLEKESAWLRDMEEKQAAIDRLKAETDESGRAMQEKAHLVQNLEAELEALRRQHEVLESEHRDREDIIRALESSILLEQQKVQQLQDRMEQSTQLFKRIYAELSGSLYAQTFSAETFASETDTNEPARPSVASPAEPVDSEVAAQ